MATKRVIEVFTSDCPVCRQTLDRVRESVAGCGCEVIERRCSGEACCEPALRYGVKAQPTIVIDGRISFEGRPSADELQALLAA